MTNITIDQLNEIKSLFEQAKEILIVMSRNPNLDSVAAALSLYLSISSRGKNATVACPDPMIVEFNHLVAVDKVKNILNGNTGRNLVISFPYQEGSIEKVSYNIENNLFNLVIEPRDGYPPVTQEVIQYSNSGGNIDMIIAIGVSKLEDLGTLYTNNQALYAEKPMINIDLNPNNVRYGKINLLDLQASSLSEIVISLISGLNLTLDSDIATNLYAGITSASQNFTSNKTTADALEAAALCLRNGARRPPSRYGQSSISMPSPFIKTPSPSPSTKMPSFTKTPPSRSKQMPPTAKPHFQPPPPPQKQTSQEAPPDWLKPKIYRGSTLL